MAKPSTPAVVGNGDGEDGDDTSDRFTGPWFGVDSGVGRDPRIVGMKRELGISVPCAVGYVVLTWGGVAEHAPTGDLSGVCDDTIERWATWEGEPGRYATAFRERFVDAAGQLRAWEKRNGKMLSRAIKERQRKRDERASVRGQSEDSPSTVPGQSAVNTTQPDTTLKAAAGADGAERKPLDVPAIARITEALNAGMRANPAIGHFKPVRVDKIAGEWLAEIPEAIISETVGRLGREFKPTAKSHAIGSLKYCDSAVREAHAAVDEERYQSLAADARRGMDMSDTTKYPDWPQYRARYKSGGKLQVAHG